MSALTPWLDAWVLHHMRQPVMQVDEPPWEEAVSLGWALGSRGGHRTLSHSGADPGFQTWVAMVPDRRTGVVVLANSNTVPTGRIARAALDVALAVPVSRVSGTAPDVTGEGMAAMRSLLPPVALPVAEALEESGLHAAATAYHRLSGLDPAEYDIDDDGFEDAVWGAIELHRTALVWPLLQVWTNVRPRSSAAWTMAGWAHQVDGHPELARSALRRALDLDPENHDAALIARTLPSA